MDSGRTADNRPIRLGRAAEAQSGAGGVEYEGSGCLGRVTGCFGQDGGVDIGGGDDAGVAEHVLHELEIDAGGEDAAATIEAVLRGRSVGPPGCASALAIWCRPRGPS